MRKTRRSSDRPITTETKQQILRSLTWLVGILVLATVAHAMVTGDMTRINAAWALAENVVWILIGRAVGHSTHR